MFLMAYGRPNIAYVVSRLSSYILNRSIGHWDYAIEMHLMDLLLNTCEVQQYYALNNSYP